MNANQRTIKLKTAVPIESKDLNALESNELTHLSFTSMGDHTPAAEDYGVQNEEQKAILNRNLQYLKSIDESFFQWLEADAANTILFANDPLKALETAILGFTNSFSLSGNPFR